MLRFAVENFLSHSVETFRRFVGEPFCAGFQKISDCEKVYG